MTVQNPGSGHWQRVLTEINELSLCCRVLCIAGISRVWWDPRSPSIICLNISCLGLWGCTLLSPSPRLQVRRFRRFADVGLGPPHGCIHMLLGQHTRQGGCHPMCDTRPVRHTMRSTTPHGVSTRMEAVIITEAFAEETGCNVD